MATIEVLAFDWGTTVVGVLDVGNNVYTPYHCREEMIHGAERIVSFQGTIVSFNGTGYDLIEISRLLGIPSVQNLKLRGLHDDMLIITSDIRWPPDPGTGSIKGPGLQATYRHYFDNDPINPPSHLQDTFEAERREYLNNNWRDCYMTAELWKKWKRGELKS